MTTRLGRSPAGAQDVLFTDRFSAGTLSPFSVFGGTWTLASGGLSGQNLGSTGLDRDFVYMPYSLTDSWTTTTVTLNRLPRRQTWRVGLVAHSLGADSPDKWALILRPGELTLLNENTAWVKSVPFEARPGRTYHLAMVVNGTTVDGKVWPDGVRPPARWMISGRFAPNRVAQATDVGLYAANAVATFRQFQVLAPPPAVSATPTASAGVFERTAVPSVNVGVTNPAVKPHTVRLRFSLATLGGRTVGRGTVPFSLRAEKTVHGVLTFPGLADGVYRFRASLMGQGSVLTRLVGQNLAVVPVPEFGEPRTTLFGLNGNLGVAAGMSEAASFAAEHFALMHEQGIEGYRLQITMPAPGHAIPLAGYARIVKRAEAARLRVLGLLTGPSPSPKARFALFLRRYRAFVRKTVRVLAHDGVRTWEIWNEPSTLRYWKLGPGRYGRLLSASVRLIHRLEPGSTVVGYAWKLPVVFRTDAVKPDAWAFHYYPGSNPPVNSSYPLAGAIDRLKAFLLRHRRPPQIWITETGWNTQEVALRTQAAYLAQAGIVAQAARAAAIFFFTQTYYGSGYGEETPDLSPKPAYVAIAAMTWMLAGSRSLGLRSPLGPEIEAAEFTAAGARTVLALWSDSGRPLTLTIPVTAGLSAYDGMGNSIAPSQGSLAMPVGPLPLYLVARDINPGTLAGLLRNATITGLPPYRIGVEPALRNGRALIRVTVENLAPQPETGDLRIILPSGLTTPRPLQALPRLGPGGSVGVSIPIRPAANAEGQALRLTVTATAQDGSEATLHSTVRVPAPPPKPPLAGRPSPTSG